MQAFAVCTRGFLLGALRLGMVHGFGDGVKSRFVTLTTGLILGMSSLTSVFAGDDNCGNCVPVAVPDSGSTMLLLGAGLAGLLVMLRRKLNK
jgi:hypothetical protein